jgi:hypothetical protein
MKRKLGQTRLRFLRKENVGKRIKKGRFNSDVESSQFEEERKKKNFFFFFFFLQSQSDP